MFGDVTGEEGGGFLISSSTVLLRVITRPHQRWSFVCGVWSFSSWCWSREVVSSLSKSCDSGTACLGTPSSPTFHAHNTRSSPQPCKLLFRDPIHGTTWFFFQSCERRVQHRPLCVVRQLSGWSRVKLWLWMVLYGFYEAQLQEDVVRAFGPLAAVIKVTFERCVRWLRKGVLPVVVLEGSGGGRACRTFSVGHGSLGQPGLSHRSTRLAKWMREWMVWVAVGRVGEAGAPQLLNSQVDSLQKLLSMKGMNRPGVRL